MVEENIKQNIEQDIEQTNEQDNLLCSVEMKLSKFGILNIY